MTQIKIQTAPRRVSASAIAAMLASDEWMPGQGSKETRKVKRVKRAESSIGKNNRGFSTDRESMETLPAGHPVSWLALWGGDRVPVFPGLVPMGSKERLEDLN